MSKIEWTGKTWNPVVGCSLVSPGCTNCYAMRMAARLEAMGQAKYAGTTRKVNRLAVWTGKINLDEKSLTIPLGVKKPTTWFVNSMSDLFHEGVPFEFVDRVFAVMALTPRHTYQILTKRPERMAEYLSHPAPNGAQHIQSRQRSVTLAIHRHSLAQDAPQAWRDLSAEVHYGQRWPLPNVWLGTSAEDQKRYDERRHHLLRCPAAVRFLSLEPLLGPIDLGDDFWESGNRVDWVIVGGESGHGARPCYTNWIDSIAEQCRAAGVALFVKQLGANHRCVDDEFGDVPIKLKDSKGGDITEFPEDLRVREMPTPAAVPQ